MLAALVSLVGGSARAVTPAGTIVSNRAEITLITRSGATATIYSNIDRFEVAATPVVSTRSQLDLFRIDMSSSERIDVVPSAYRAGGESGPLLPVAWPHGMTRDEAQGRAKRSTLRPLTWPQDITLSADGSVTVGYSRAKGFRAGEPILVRLVDPDQNRDPDQRDAVTVRMTYPGSSEIEVLELRETGPNTGTFGGIIVIEAVAVHAYDGRISIVSDTALEARYSDPSDASDQATHDMLIDPFGQIFDSATGEPINGIAITLLDATTGQPAVVRGADGVSAYPATVVTGEPVQDASGHVYEPSPGKFTFPFVAPGTYRYQLTLPNRSGYTFPSTEADATLNTLPGAPFALGPGSRGDSFAVVLDPVETDLPLDPKSESLVLNLRAAVNRAGLGDFVQFTAELTNQRGLQAFTHVVVEDTLPVGFRLEPSSVRLENGSAVQASVAPDGRRFTFTIPHLAPGETTRISYVTRITAARPGRAINRASATSGRLRSNEATAAVTIQDDLMSTRSHILGRVSRFQAGRPTGEGIAGVAVFLETGTMTVTDERGFFRIEGVKPGTHVVQIDKSTLPHGAKPVLTRDSTEGAGSPFSRFVDLAPGSLWNVEFEVEVDQETADRTESVSNEVSGPSSPNPEVRSVTLEYNQEWIDAEAVSQEWLLPADGASPPTPAVRILVKHHPAHKVTAFLNGQPVNGLNFDGTLTSKAKTLAASLWSGVNLVEGDNQIEIVRTDSFGNERGREKRVVHFASPPVRAEIVLSESTLVADGVTPPVLAVRLFDRDDRPARTGVTGRVQVREPYSIFREDAHANIRLLPGAAPEQHLFVVGEDGLARIQLMPTAVSGAAHVTIYLVTGEHEFRADLRSDRKEWILVGLAEGTPAYQTINGNLETAQADELEDGWDMDGRVAFFAKGRVRGGWLLTAAYDSNKERPRPGSLHGKIDPDAYYTVYGDQSQRLEAAPSSRKLYVKLEREAVSALFGDFTLDWTTTAFTTYARDLHGAVVNYRGKRIRASAFQSEAGLKFARDEFRGTGLSGPFQLSRQNIVPFSEKVVIEERDTLRPDIVVEQRSLQRDFDYTIDPITGTLRLSEPLFANSPKLRPQFVVVRYEMEDDTAGVVTGGRVEFLPTDKVLVGTTHLAEEHDGATNTLSGVDARVAVTKHVTVFAEAARSDTAAGVANAYRAEVWHRSETSDTRAYLRHVDAGFGLGQLNNSQTGNRQIGIEGSQRFTTKLTARELVYRETVLATGDQRDAAEAQLEFVQGPWTFRGGAKIARDERNDGADVEKSVLATAGISRRLAQDRLELSVDREQSVDGEVENLDFPTRTVLGARYALTQSTSLRAEHEWTEAKDRKTTQSRFGVESTPWTGGTVNGAVMQSYGGSPATLLGGGLKQTLQLTPTIGVEGGFERSRVISGAAAEIDPTTGLPAAPRTPFHPTSGFSSVAQGNATSGFAGVHWKPGDVLYNARAEMSDTDAGRRVGFLASAQTEPGKDLGLVASLIAFRQTSDTARTITHIDLRFGAAWRPDDGATIVLQRFDIVRGPSGGTTGGAQAWKLIENLHFNRRFGDKLQLSIHLGGKYVWDSIGGVDFSGFTTIAAFELRRDLWKKWDIGVHAAELSAWGASTSRRALGVSLGHSFARNVWASIGYNFTGFRDTDFMAGRYSSPGVFLKFRVRFDQESLKGLIDVIKAE